MNEVIFLATVASVYFILAASPGPNFLIISVAAASKSRKYAAFVALGVSTASIIWSSLAVMGLGLVLLEFQGAQRILQILGGGYLLYIGVKTIFNSKKPLNSNLSMENNGGYLQAFRQGLLTNMGNPKTLIFFSSIFATLFSNDTALWLKVSSVIVVGTVSISWNLLVVLFFASSKAKTAYTKSKKWIDRIAGGLISVFSLKLMFNWQS